MSEEAGRAFWNFSLGLYGKPGVAPACLGLQERLGADVNLLLYGCWAASQGRALAPADIARADGAMQLWREQVVEPLRRVRNRLKEGVMPLGAQAAQALRKRVLDAEIAGEELAQHALATLLPEAKIAGTAAEAARTHVETYLARLATPLSTEDRAAIDRLIGACFG